MTVPTDRPPEVTDPAPAARRRPTPRRPAPEPAIVAAVDVGSTSVHLLVAVAGSHRLEPLLDESVFLGLGTAADDGVLGPAARGSLVTTLAHYGDAARRLGSRSITFVATEPLRRAADAAPIVHAVERATGSPLHVLTHEEEALLTLVGVTAGRPVTDDLAVVDVGGGSSEIVGVGPGRRAAAFGLRLGAARLTERYVTSDPPTADEIAALRAAARETLADAPALAPARLVAVGGTASNLLRVLPRAALDRTLSRRRLVDALAVLLTEPSALAAERHAIRLVRSRILPAGAVILEAILDRYGLDRLHVSDEGLREGTILVTAHAGPAWRDGLEHLAHGWR
jgi:exopolyphosphatase/guanosine-5'-triphosphate,3'-diphosphate pyrophosphatase